MKDDYLLSHTCAGLDWIQQFDDKDQADAALLLNSIRWVSHHEFTNSILELVNELTENNTDKVAIFVEREVKEDEFAYEFPLKLPRRSVGAAFQAIKSNKNRQEVGSEGILNNIATNMQRNNNKLFFYFPSMEVIRKNNIRKIVILTDTIGSGSQISAFLNSFWNVPTIKSWVSLKIVDFYVVCFSATEYGIEVLKRHPLKINLRNKLICPTIYSSIKKENRQRIIELCYKYDPFKKKESNELFLPDNEALGFNGQGVLIAYYHGIPNNSPRLLHKSNKKWVALFKGRSSLGIQNELPSSYSKLDEEKYLEVMNQKRLSASKKLATLSNQSKSIILVMAALYSSPRTDNALSIRTGLSLKEISEIMSFLKFHEWVNEFSRITDEGYFLLKTLKKKRSVKKTISFSDKPYYYPSSLREPE